MVCSTLHALNSFGLLSQSYYEKPLKLEKTTSSIISVIGNYSLCFIENINPQTARFGDGMQ